MVDIGCGVSEITPPIGTPLSGFIFRENRPSTGVDDPLFVRVLALRDRAQYYWLVSYELLGISAQLQNQIITELSTGLGSVFSPERCVIVAVHNHSGPPTMSLRGETQISPAYLSNLCQSTLIAAQDALQKLQPAVLYSARMEIPGLTYNRRALLEDGRVTMALHPDAPVLQRGPVDSRLTLLLWKDPSGDNLAAAVHFACHGVAVCTQNIGSDIPGAISRYFERILKVPCLFLQGAAGDINPLVVSTERSEMLPWVAEFEEIIRDLPLRLEPIVSDPFSMAAMVLPLEYVPLPTRQQVSQRIKQFERIACGEVASPEVAEAVRLLGDLMNVLPGELPDAHKAAFCAQALLASEREILEIIDHQGNPDTCPLRLTLWRMGSIVMLFAGAELFAQTGQSIRQLAGDLDILPVTYATPVVGYIPDAAAMDSGGYEVDFAWHFYRSPAPFAPQTEARVVEAVDGMIGNLRN